MSDYTKMTVAQLKTECTKLALDITGKKADLVQRLTAANGHVVSCNPAPTVPVVAPAVAAPVAHSGGRSKRKVAAVVHADEEEEQEAAPQAKRGRKAASSKKKKDEEKGDEHMKETNEDEVAPIQKVKGKGKGTAAKVKPASKDNNVAEQEENDTASTKAALNVKNESMKKEEVKVIATQAAASSSSSAKAVYKVDPACHLASASVLGDYDALLNQTNLGANNNKFFKLQVLVSGGSYYCWSHWGRVGEHGQNALASCGSDPAAAIATFEKKFKDKTSNQWSNRVNFASKPGKYTLLEMDHSADEEDEQELEARLAAFNSSQSSSAAAAAGGYPSSPVPTKFRPSVLSAPVQDLMALLFDQGMFTQAMAKFEIDVSRMPLGKLSKAQIQKGYDILDEIQKLIDAGGSHSTDFNELTSKFYTLIPHDFGRKVPSPINTAEHLKNKVDLLNVLNDIEIAQSLQADAKKKDAAQADEQMNMQSLPPNPIDAKYDSLKCDVEVVKSSDKNHHIIMDYINNTKSGWPSKLEVVEIYSLNRHGEDKRFAEHDAITNRRLLWHGTNVAVVAAILNSGLRIMPHSGGRVGRGIYLADQHGKSSAYVGPTTYKGQQQAIMFLAEAALGEEHAITRDDSSLKAAPKGFDSIVARGYTGPDTKSDVIIKIDEKDVRVPQSKVVDQNQYKGSSFDKSEFLLYKESQHRLRYAVRFNWAH